MGRTTKISKEDAVLAKLGERVRGLREERDFNVSVAARRAGIETESWRRIEKGTGDPSVATLVRVALALGTTLADLVSQPDGPPRA
jgi:transcriptional regulator with XRE-family HTH domain